MADLAQTKFDLALKSREDLQDYGDNAHLLFALELLLRIDDISGVAEAALTDGPDDKKCDLCYVDRSSGVAVIAQGYVSSSPGRASAPANKASDLNTAVAWLLGRPIDDLPLHLQSPAAELREAIESDEISSIDIWYCHNLPESPNVENELTAVAGSAQSLLEKNYPSSTVDSIRAIEVGRNVLEKWYESREVAIFVTDDFEIPISGGYEETGDGWEAFCTSIPAVWLHDQFGTYGRDLFSANVREYLGSRRSKKNINNNIQSTARSTPLQFWAYNNGVTALVNNYEAQGSGQKRSLNIRGVAVVNGAQTSGALGSVEREHLESARVMARFVKCSDPAVVREIIRYNNSQNPIEASDFRSNDQTQARLRQECQTIPGVVYLGGRRGGDEDKIRRPRDVIPHYTAAQALAAFHGEPSTAYNDKSKIWEDDAIYSRFFGDHTTGPHLVFCYGLLRSVEHAKRAISSKDPDHRTKREADQFDFFRRRGSHFLLMFAIAESLESVTDRAIPDPFSLSFSQATSLDEAINTWKPVVDVALAFTGSLAEVLGYHLKNREMVSGAVESFQGLISATADANRPKYEQFARRLS